MHKAAAHAKRGLPLRHLPAMDLPFLVLVLTLVGFGRQMPQRQAAFCMGSSFVHPYHPRSFIVRGGGAG